MKSSDIRPYYNYIKSFIANKNVRNHEYAVTYAPLPDGLSYYIRTRENNPLKFIDGASLRFREQITIVDRQVQRIAYSYHYERSDTFFRYDKDPKVVNPAHALCHLHAHQEEPCFPSHEASLENVFQFILAVYY
jgi:hypothetical protein